MPINVKVQMDVKEKIARYEELVAEMRKKCPGIRAALLCPATAHLSDRRKFACLTCSKRRCLRFHELGLDDDGAPLAEDLHPECGAKTKTGEPCDEPVVPGKPRCRAHGGLSTGPKTEEAGERIKGEQCRRWQP